jgi:hypothetical protein
MDATKVTGIESRKARRTRENMDGPLFLNVFK